jgi:hypothetical protein
MKREGGLTKGHRNLFSLLACLEWTIPSNLNGLPSPPFANLLEPPSGSQQEDPSG